MTSSNTCNKKISCRYVSSSVPRVSLLGSRFLLGLAVICCVFLWGSTWQSSLVKTADFGQNRVLFKTWAHTKRAVTVASFSDSSYDGFNTPAVQCRLGMEHWQNNNIDYWMKNPPYPLVEWVWKLIDQTTNKTYYKVLLNVMNCGQQTKKRTYRVAWHYDWTWEDQYGNTHPIHKWQIKVENLRLSPRLFFRLSDGNATSETTPLPTKLWPTFSNGTIPIEYDLKPYIHCNKVEQENPPPPEVKIGACITRFWGQHDLMPEWIAYHRMIGIQHFWFFVSEPFGNIYETMPRYEKDITYIPYNYTWEGHKHNGGREEMIQTPSGWSAGGENWWQPMANNQCLYMAKQYGLDWVMTPDVDEYVVIHDPTIKHFGNPSPLQQYFQRYYPQQQQQPSSTTTTDSSSSASSLDEDNANSPAQPAQVCLNGGGYGKHPRKDNDTVFELTIDFTYRRNLTFGNGARGRDGRGAGGRRKCFYNPHLVHGVDTHGKHVEWWQENLKDCANTSQMELYHFRSPLLGPEGVEPKKLVSYPELRDMYREKLLEEMKRLNWALPKFDYHMCKRYTCADKSNDNSESLASSFEAQGAK